MTRISELRQKTWQGVAALSCILVVLWSVLPTATHVPTVLETLQQHAETIASHGHSHGLEEDLIWAMHGHSHDALDHDHSQAIVIPLRHAVRFNETNAEWRGLSQPDRAQPVFRLEKPPRA